MPPIKITLMLCCLFFIKFAKAQLKNDVFICYGKFHINTIKNYTYVIIEPGHFTPEDIHTLKQNNTYVLAYMSLGEVNVHASHFKTVEPYVLDKNELWNSYTLDISNSITKDALINIISRNINDGYDGFFLDNIDSYTNYGKVHHLKNDLLHFLETIKTKFPSIFLIQNAGLSLTKETKNFVNAIATESVASDYQFNSKTYQLRDDEAFSSRIRAIKLIQKHNDLPFIFIEYSNNKTLTKAITKRLKKVQKSKNNSIFIGEINLQSIPKKQ